MSLFFVLLLTLSPAAFAEDTTTSTKVDVESQTKAIEKGIEAGDLTYAEARRLKLQQKKIDRIQKKMAGDGQISAEEQARLDLLQRRATKDIRHEKRDGAKRRK